MNEIMKNSRGFTLIELLMSIAIIAILASFTMTWIDTARAKSRDTLAISEFHQVQTALLLYYDKYGRYPNETPVMSNPYVDNFNNMAAQLVTEGFLGSVPVAPANHLYHYYNYGGTTIGGLLVTSLETYPDSTGYSGSCRPWPAGAANWCTTNPTKDYCLCNPY
ncbi:MAG: type II secretion system protein [Candidatus Zambryskibacteria bacterium]|nr:type II secretion system protein [Candidatus Zambryskibacteria bacterium]